MVLECSGCEVVDDEELKLNVGVEVGLAGGLAMSRRWSQCVQKVQAEQVCWSSWSHDRQITVALPPTYNTQITLSPAHTGWNTATATRFSSYSSCEVTPGISGDLGSSTTQSFD